MFTESHRSKVTLPGIWQLYMQSAAFFAIAHCESTSVHFYINMKGIKVQTFGAVGRLLGSVVIIRMRTAN